MNANEALTAMKIQAEQGRAKYVPGTPEKYPRADMRVIILDFEAWIKAFEEALND